MKTHFFRLALVALLSCLTIPPVQAQTRGSGGGPGFDPRAKSENKAGQRWTLQQWLEQKDRNMMMDLWLGMYAPSPYEFYLSGAYLSYDRETSSTTQPTPTIAPFRSYKGSVGAYALLVGVVGEYENNTEENYNDLAGSLNLRILGNAVQGTHLIVQYGLRTRQFAPQQKLSQQFAGADLNIYLMKYFGLHGLYRSFLPTHEETLGDVNAQRTEAGAFLDFGPVRLFGDWFQERQDATLSGNTTRTQQTGTQGGIQIFF